MTVRPEHIAEAKAAIAYDRAAQSLKAARVLRAILAANPAVPGGFRPHQRRQALELAISVLEARAIDAEKSDQ